MQNIFVHKCVTAVGRGSQGNFRSETGVCSRVNVDGICAMAERKNGDSGVQGEGDYTSARTYKRDIENFVNKKSDEIPEMAKEAEDALKGPEGDELKKAEEKGKSKARH